MGRISESITLTGSLRAKESVDVSPRVAGRLTQLLADTGQVVAKGALLATIEDDEIRQQIERSNATLAVVDAQITQREAELANARIELDRRIQLVEAGVLSRNELDTLVMRVCPRRIESSRCSASDCRRCARASSSWDLATVWRISSVSSSFRERTPASTS